MVQRYTFLRKINENENIFVTKIEENGNRNIALSVYFRNFAILKEVFCKDTNFLRKGKARACESLGFVVNKNNFFSSVSEKRRKNEKGAP